MKYIDSQEISKRFVRQMHLCKIWNRSENMVSGKRTRWDGRLVLVLLATLP